MLWTQLSWARTQLLLTLAVALSGTNIIEYRVWCHPEGGSPNSEEGSDDYYPFATYAEALAFSQSTAGAEEPLALVRQREYIAEPNPASMFT